MTYREVEPIQGWFVPRQVPDGAAPEQIREQWVDLPMPLRQISPDETPNITIGHDLGDMLSIHVREGVDVYAFDAVKALRLFGKTSAAEFWESVLYPDQGLIFGAEEGQIYPTPIIQRILPGIEFFDQTEV